MAFPELPDDRRARPRRYRGGDTPERPGRRRVPEDPPPTPESGVDEQDWLLGAALQHGVPVGEDDDPEAADPAAGGVRTRHAAGPDAGGPVNGSRTGPDPGDEIDSLRARYAERLRGTYSYDAGGPDAAPGRRRAPSGDDERSWPPPGRRAEDAPPRATGNHRVEPGPPPYGAPAAGGPRPEGTGRHGVADERGGRRGTGGPSGAHRNGAPADAAGPAGERPGPNAPGRNTGANGSAVRGGGTPAARVDDGGARHPRGPRTEGARRPNEPGGGVRGRRARDEAPGPDGRDGDPSADPARPAGPRHGSEPQPRRGPDGYAGPPGPPRRPGPPPGPAGPPRGRPAPAEGYAPDPRAARPGAPATGRPDPAGPDRGAKETGAFRDGAAPRRRPEGPPAGGPPGAVAASGGLPTGPVRPDGEVRRRPGGPADPEPPERGPDGLPAGMEALDRPPGRRRRRPTPPAPEGEPGADGAPDTGGPPDPAGEPATDTDGPRVGKRSGPVGIAGRLAALTGRGGSGDGEKRQVSFWKELPLLIGVALVLTFLIQTFLAKVYVIPSGSMETTLQGCTGCNNDRVLVDKVTYNFSAIAPGDVVVFKGPDSWSSQEYTGEPSSNPLVRGLETAGSLIGIAPPDEKDFVKRVIATGGQTVACCDALNQVMVDGQPLEEPYTYYLPEAGPARQIPFGPVKVPEGELWLMGDSRNNSADSRAAGHGPVPEDNVIGKVRLIVLPFDRFGWVSAIDPQTTATAAGAPGPPAGLPVALGMMGVLPLAASRRLTLRARSESERFLPATRPPNGWRRRA